MSCTSAISSVLIGTSTVLSYDVYKTCTYPSRYRERSLSDLFLIDINPKATDSQVLRAGHWCVAGFAVFMASFASMLHGVNIDLGFIYVSFLTNFIAFVTISLTDFVVEYDWNLYWLCFACTCRYLFLVSTRSFGSHCFYLDRILCCRDHLGTSYLFITNTYSRNNIDFSTV
jgi:hypothetical protein